MGLWVVALLPFAQDGWLGPMESGAVSLMLSWPVGLSCRLGGTLRPILAATAVLFCKGFPGDWVIGREDNGLVQALGTRNGISLRGAVPRIH
jgi:hypothetical protein